jgi:hypothetical protein
LRLRTLIIVAMLSMLPLVLAASDVIEQIVARVNGNVVLQSDWEDEIGFEAFSQGRTLESVTLDQRKAALDRLIDRDLLREQMPEADLTVSHDEVAARVAEIRAQYPQAADAEAWHTLLGSYRLTQDDLEGRVSEEHTLLRLVDSRLRPSVRIDQASIESYYNQELVPQLKQQGAKEISLAEVSPKIKDLLTERKVNELLTAWLQNLRSGSQILTNLPPDSGSRAR